MITKETIEILTDNERYLPTWVESNCFLGASQVEAGREIGSDKNGFSKEGVDVLSGEAVTWGT